MNVDELSTEALNKQLAIQLTLTNEENFSPLYQNGEFNFCESWDLLMPHVINHGINIYQTSCLGLKTGNLYASNIHGDFKVMKCEDPQRAIAECLLLILENQDVAKE
jgi:hypothetical protein